MPVRTASTEMTRYHSGISGSDASSPGVRVSAGWNGSAPQRP